jgi:hypothetical protein
MDKQSVLLRIESVLAIEVASFKDRKSNPGFSSAISQTVNLVPFGDSTATSTEGRWFRLKVF